MPKRRVLIIVLAVLVVAMVSIVLLQTGPFAQEGGAPPGGPPPGPGGPPGGPGGPGGEPGMPGAPGGGAPAGGTFEWKTYPPPPELTITYDQWLMQTGNKRAAIPQAFLIDETATPPVTAKHTPNEWFQLQRVYAARGAEEGPVEGRVGKAVMRWFEPWAAVKVTQATALVSAYEAGLRSFSFEVGFPVSAGMTFDPSTASVTQVNNIIIPVIMRVRPSAQKSYGELVYRKLKKFDCYGHGRDTGSDVVNTSAPFSIVTYKGGYWQPRVLNLEPEMGPIWDNLWSGNQVRLTLLDRQNKTIATAQQPAGHNGSILGKMLYPDKIYYSPRYKLVLPPEGRKFGGGKWHIAGTKGQVYAFSFSMPVADARRINSAKVEYVGTPNALDLARGRLSTATMPAPPSAGASAGGGGAAGGAPGGPEGPGGPGGPGPGGMPPGGPGGPPPPP
jgi:hypothetical protein